VCQIWYADRHRHKGHWWAKITLLVKFKMVVICTKFGTQNNMPMMIRRSKSKLEVEFQYGGYGTDTTSHRTYFLGVNFLTTYYQFVQMKNMQYKMALASQVSTAEFDGSRRKITLSVQSVTHPFTSLDVVTISADAEEYNKLLRSNFSVMCGMYLFFSSMQVVCHKCVL